MSLSDGVTVTLKAIKKEQSSFRKDVEKTKKSLKDTYNKNYEARLNTSKAGKAINSLTKKLQPFNKKLVKAVAIKDLASDKARGISNRVRALGKIVATPLVKLKDKTTGGISKISGKLKGAFKAIAIPVAIAATVASVAIGGAVSSGMQLEQQKVSMEHFIGATNKGMSTEEVKKVAAGFTQELRDNANATPFETGDVIEAGSRAIAIAGGNTKDAMGMVKLAEDMAAASGGTKTISDAIEALADAKLGETERLKEFGFKVSAEEFKAKGFKGVSADLEDFYGGAAEKLAGTGAGLLSTIKGKLKSNYADFGLKVVEQLKPAFEKIIGFIDKVSPTMEKFGLKIADGIGVAIGAISDFAPQFKSGLDVVKPMVTNLLTGLQPIVFSIGNLVKTLAPVIIPPIVNTFAIVSSLISKAAPFVTAVIDGIGVAISTIAPIVSTIATELGEKFGGVIDFLASKSDFIRSVFDTVAPAISEVLSVSWGIISPILDLAIVGFEGLFSVVEFVFPKIQEIVSGVWDVLKPIFEGIGTGISDMTSGIKTGFGNVKDFFSIGGGSDKKDKKNKKIGANARGTNNWSGGLTWVGEEGPELIDLPRGSRVLPNKESISFASSYNNDEPNDYKPFPKNNGGGLPTPKKLDNNNTTKTDNSKNVEVNVNVNIAGVTIREEADIDKLGKAIAKEIKKVKLV